MMETEIESAKRIYDILNDTLVEKQTKYEERLTSKNETIFVLEEQNKKLSEEVQIIKQKLNAFTIALQGVKE